MASEIEIRERLKRHLGSLLKLKAANTNVEIAGLYEEIRDLVGVMEQEDVSWMEKIYGIKAL